MGRAEDLYEQIIAKGEAAIDYLVETRKSEELFLDFKRSADDGRNKTLNNRDRSSLEKAVSGFGNSEGGIVIWGVDCSKDSAGADVARFKVPVVDVGRFVSWLEEAVSGCTIPPHRGVRSHAVRVGGEGGFAVTYIPKSDDAPLQAVPRLQYFIRAGSSFVPTPHGVLAGMFGRRPQPNLAIRVQLGKIGESRERLAFATTFELRLVNLGPTIASDLFLNLLFLMPGQNCRVSREYNAQIWENHQLSAERMSLISHPNIRLPPGAHLKVATVTLAIEPSISAGIRVEGMFGCGNASPVRFLWQNDEDGVRKVYQYMNESRRDADSLQSLEFGEKLLKLDKSLIDPPSKLND